MTLCAEGRAVPAAEISIVPVVGKRDAQQKYITIAMANLRVRAIAASGTGEDSFSTETLTLAFEKIKFEYYQYADATPGAEAGAAISYAFNWDVAKGAAS